MSSMESLNALVNTLHNTSTNSLLLASKLSSTTPSLQAYLEAAAEFKRNTEAAEAMFRVAVKSANAVHSAKKDEEKENGDVKGEGEDEESMGEQKTGRPKIRLVRWSEHIASEVEVRLKNEVVPSIQLGFQAYLQNEVIPALENRVLARLEQRVQEKDRLSALAELDPPPYNDAHSAGLDRKRSTESAPREGPEDRPVFWIPFMIHNPSSSDIHSYMGKSELVNPGAHVPSCTTGKSPRQPQPSPRFWVTQCRVYASNERERWKERQQRRSANPRRQVTVGDQREIRDNLQLRDNRIPGRTYQMPVGTIPKPTMTASGTVEQYYASAFYQRVLVLVEEEWPEWSKVAAFRHPRYR
ncbi:hypothetical protein C8T65DRAFT_692888 [Cerioporus squamosus]|nr:hypothetical protein C8T65DRAFT_692888 [Cerioporus squamosus]